MDEGEDLEWERCLCIISLCIIQRKSFRTIQEILFLRSGMSCPSPDPVQWYTTWQRIQFLNLLFLLYLLSGWWVTLCCICFCHTSISSGPVFIFCLFFARRHQHLSRTGNLIEVSIRTRDNVKVEDRKRIIIIIT